MHSLYLVQVHITKASKHSYFWKENGTSLIHYTSN